MSAVTIVGMINITWMEYGFVLMTTYREKWGFKLNLGKTNNKGCTFGRFGVDDSL